MCQRSLIVSVIIIFVSGRSTRGTSQTIQFPLSESSPTYETVSASSSMSRLPIPLLLQLDDPATFSFAIAESTEEQQGYTYNSYYAPATVNFHDIYSNHLALLADEPVPTTTKDDASFHLKNINQYVEFHPKTQTIPTSTTPPPMFLLNSSQIKNDTEQSSTSTSSTSTTTEEPEENAIKVIPIKKNYQRGVLDLLFPASRVKTFKSVFDTFRRILSHTFR